MTLTEKRIGKLLRSPGRYRDEGDGAVRGLYLQVTTGGASWLLRFDVQCEPRVTKPKEGKGRKTDRRERWMGLGSYRDFSLKEARARAKAKRQLLADSIDPLELKKSEKASKALAASKTKNFEECARAYFDQNQKKWKNAKHAAQFISTLQEYCFPLIGKLPVGEVDTGAVLGVLEQKHKNYPNQRLWDAVPETASRLRGRIESVLAWATTRKFRSGDNPAKWTGHLDTVLPARGDVQKVRHHPALPYASDPEKGLRGVAEFMIALQKREGIAAKALEFCILTAARTSAVTGATWDEINLQEKVWEVPASRAGTKIVSDGDVKARRVPLSDRAIEIMKSLPTEDGNPHLFIGGKAGCGLSNMAMAELMKGMAFASTTPGRIAVPHGFRSCFKDWVSETRDYPNHVSEAALWHAVADKVEASYRRGDLFNKRKQLMAEWAKFCATPPVVGKAGNVTALRGRK